MDKKFESMQLNEEKYLFDFLEKSINMRLVNSLLEFKEKRLKDNFLPFYMRGFYLPINKEFGGKIYDVCQEVINELDYKENLIEFYISNNPEINSSSIYSSVKENAHIIIINRGLIEKLNIDELKFVIGHEIGHLIYNHSYVTKNLQAIFPNYSDLPPYLKITYNYWTKITEISSDRVGLLASKNLESSIKAIFKISSGLEDNYYKMNLEGLISIIEKIFNEMKSYPTYVSSSHPANPIRILSLKIFYESKLWDNIIKGNQIEIDEELNREQDEIIDIIRKTPLNEQETVELMFLVSSGIMIMTSDKEITNEEYNYLTNIISFYIQFPQIMINNIMKDNYYQIFKDSAKILLDKYPWRIRSLFKYLINIITVDRKLTDQETNVFFKIGIDELKIPVEEVVDILLEGLRDYYRPLY